MQHRIFEEIKDAKFSDMIFQPTKNIISATNMYVINFKKGRKLYSLHVFCSLRVIFDNKILLTCTDELLDENHNRIDSTNEIGSLVDCNISIVKQLASQSTVSLVEIYDYGDLIISLSNGMIIEVRPDYLGNSFEYYRLFEYGNPSNKVIVSYIETEKTNL